MLISFSISNWKCFRDEVTFSLVAGREKHFTERLPRVSKYKLKTLPISAIYGAMLQANLLGICSCFCPKFVA